MVKRYFSVDNRIFLGNNNNTSYTDILVNSSNNLKIIGEFIGSISC